MQLRNIYMSIAIVMAAAASANAQNHIESFGGVVAGTDYDIADATGEITIYTANGNDYAFWAEDSGAGPGTGFIDDIILDDPESMTGNFTLLIADPNYPNDPKKPGALQWNAGDLRYDAGTSTLINVHLAGDLASDGDIGCDNITGTVMCQDVIHNVTIDYGSLTGSFTANDITGTITIVRGRLNGSLTANTLGDVSCLTV
jgi:hypothetical protein